MNNLRSIKDRALNFYYCLRKPSSLEHALKQIAPPSLVTQLKKDSGPDYLVEKTANALDTDVYTVLEAVAANFSMPTSISIATPNPNLISSIGFNSELLKKHSALPQAGSSNPSSYSLVISDPKAINAPQFRKQGVEIHLGLQSDIENSWRKYDFAEPQFGLQISKAQIMAVAKQLAEDACSHGATEVFIGHPEPASYEFRAGSKRYAGKLHPAFYQTLLDCFQDVPRLEPEIDSMHLQKITLALTRNFEHPVVCLTWRAQSLNQQQDLSPAKKELASAESPDKASPRQIHSTEQDELINHSVLLVDDDQRFLAILSSILESKGWAVSTKAHGKAALDFLKKNSERIDLIVCDVHMPIMDGAIFLRLIKERNLLTPVLMLTSDQDSMLEAELAMIGADAFVRKQEDPRVLLAWCNNLVKRKNSLEPEQLVQALQAIEMS